MTDDHSFLPDASLSDMPIETMRQQPLLSDIDATQVAAEWLSNFARNVESGDVESVMMLFRDDAYWRDTLSITWDFRTFKGPAKIRQFLQNRLRTVNLHSFSLVKGFMVPLPFDPTAFWLHGIFTFEIGDVGVGDGLFKILMDSNKLWKAYTMYTNLRGLQKYPENAGAYRNHTPNHGKWLENRRQELEFKDIEPYVVVIGGGHSGLHIAARLKMLDVSTLVLEKEPRIGDQWRSRYEPLCLHDPVWYNHMPYLPFPDSWPVYTPAHKLAHWLESYAHFLELNVWTSSKVTFVSRDPETKRWNVFVRRGGENNPQRILHPVHVVFAVGLMSGAPRMPVVAGQDDFNGKVLHSTQFKTAANHIGKKVVVIGTGSSAHDIASDHVEHGIDVTMYQRSSVCVMSMGAVRMLLSFWREGGPSTEEADLTSLSSPREVLHMFLQGVTKVLTEYDRELLDGLAKRGFKYNFGHQGSGLTLLSWTRGGGYYIDSGASKMIIDGQIKLKNDSVLDRFTKKGLKFQDGSELEADIVIFATGFQNVRDSIRNICGDDIKDQIKPIWGLDEEGEMRSVWRDCGVKNMWIMMGNLSTSRMHSRALALQIKAMKEGILSGGIREPSSHSTSKL